MLGHYYYINQLIMQEYYRFANSIRLEIRHIIDYPMHSEGLLSEFSKERAPWLYQNVTSYWVDSKRAFFCLII